MIKSEFTKQTIIIGTTAINRPEIHNKVLPDWINWLSECNNNYDISWFINIDTIDVMDYTYEETKENIISLIKPHVKNVFILPKQNEKFLGACKQLATTINKYVTENISTEYTDDLKIIWLEDDWEIVNHISFYDLLKFSGNYTHINLTGMPHNYIHILAPSILSYNFWKTNFHDGWILQKKDICPEKCVFNTFNKSHNNNFKNVTIYLDDIPNKNNDTVNIKTNIKNYFKFDNEPIFIRTFLPMCIDTGRNYAESKGYVKTYQNGGRKCPIIVYKKLN